MLDDDVQNILSIYIVDATSYVVGNIVAVTGLGKAFTGDTLLAKASSINKYDEASKSLPSLTIADPVFMCSIEPYSSQDQKSLDEALSILLREDPSLRYWNLYIL